MGLKPGWPDVLVLHRRLIGIELKRRGGRLSRTRVVRTRRGTLRELVGQEEVFPRLQEAGMVIGVCHSSGEVLTFLAACGVPLRVHGDGGRVSVLRALALTAVRVGAERWRRRGWWWWHSLSGGCDGAISAGVACGWRGDD